MCEKGREGRRGEGGREGGEREGGREEGREGDFIEGYREMFYSEISLILTPD